MLKVPTSFHPKALFVLSNKVWIFDKLTTNKGQLRSKQNAENNSLISDNCTLEVVFEGYVVMRTLWYIIIVLAMHIAEQEMVKHLRQHNIIWHW